MIILNYHSTALSTVPMHDCDNYKYSPTQTSNLCSEENIVDAYDNDSYRRFYLFTYLFIYFIKNLGKKRFCKVYIFWTVHSL